MWGLCAFSNRHEFLTRFGLEKKYFPLFYSVAYQAYFWMNKSIHMRKVYFYIMVICTVEGRSGDRMNIELSLQSEHMKTQNKK